MTSRKRGRKRRGKPFAKGFDPRRHELTIEDCRKGGLTTARRYLCIGQWFTDWYDRCDRKVRINGVYVDGEEESDRDG